ncbi:hypothetical protein AB1Y20_006143 [Prymnesium parvum]|uniref:CS domain-containing protein n=1 Tax=Prymnesium parvum TaxID=97485 RepID=A0AB34J3Z8_PRYPA
MGTWDAHYKIPHMPVDPSTLPPDDERYVKKELHDGEPIEQALQAAMAGLKSDILWGTLGMPMESSIEKLHQLEDERDEDKARAIRKEIRSYLELSVKQLEEMIEKGNFHNEYRIVVSAWYMMMLPSTKLGTPLLPPQEAQRAAWDWEERDIEYRRQKGAVWRAAREDASVFDIESAVAEPFTFTQVQPASHTTGMTVTVRVPPKTKAKDVRATVEEQFLQVVVVGHPLTPVISGKLFDKVDTSLSEWHLEGEFEDRILCVELEKKLARRWPCLLMENAPALEPLPPAPRAVKIIDPELDNYLSRDQDKYFKWDSSMGGATPN